MERTQLLVSPFYGTPDVSHLEVHGPSLDKVSLADLLRNGFVYPPYSIYENVRLFSCGFDPSQDLFDEAHYEPIFRDTRHPREHVDEQHDWVGEYHERLCESLRTATQDMSAPWLLQRATAACERPAAE